jgi:hypothetical protein
MEGRLGKAEGNAGTEFSLCAWAHQRTGSSDARHDGGHGGPSIIDYKSRKLAALAGIKSSRSEMIEAAERSLSKISYSTCIVQCHRYVMLC